MLRTGPLAVNAACFALPGGDGGQSGPESKAGREP